MPSDLLKYHQWCISDDVLMSAYAEAIRKVVKPGDVVVDLGAGTGILGYMACRAGAARVYAVEPTDIIAVIPDVAKANGFQDRIIPIKGESFDVTLPEKADVILASMLPAGGVPGDMLCIILDARKRFLKTGGRVIPESIHPVFCPVQYPQWYADHVGCWSSPRQGWDFRVVREIAANRAGSSKVPSTALLAAPLSLEEVQFNKFETDEVRGDLEFRIEKAGAVHAIAGWVDLKMADGVHCSNSPLLPQSSWDNLLLPLPSPVEVETEDAVHLTIRSKSIGKSPLQSWETIFDVSGKPRTRFRQSDFLGFLLFKKDLDQNALAHCRHEL